MALTTSPLDSTELVEDGWILEKEADCCRFNQVVTSAVAAVQEEGCLVSMDEHISWLLICSY